MNELHKRRYLVVVELDRATPNRIAEVVPKLKTCLERLTGSPISLALRSIHADIFAFAIQSGKHAGQILSALEAPGNHRWFSDDKEILRPFLDSSDHIMVLEIGDDCTCGVGFTKFGTWLQYH